MRSFMVDANINVETLRFEFGLRNSAYKPKRETLSFIMTICESGNKHFHRIISEVTFYRDSYNPKELAKDILSKLRDSATKELALWGPELYKLQEGERFSFTDRAASILNELKIERFTLLDFRE